MRFLKLDNVVFRSAKVCADTLPFAGRVEPKRGEGLRKPLSGPDRPTLPWAQGRVATSSPPQKTSASARDCTSCHYPDDWLLFDMPFAIQVKRWIPLQMVGFGRSLMRLPRFMVSDSPGSTVLGNRFFRCRPLTGAVVLTGNLIPTADAVG